MADGANEKQLKSWKKYGMKIAIALEPKKEYLQLCRQIIMLVNMFWVFSKFLIFHDKVVPRKKNRRKRTPFELKCHHYVLHSTHCVSKKCYQRCVSNVHIALHISGRILEKLLKAKPNIYIFWSPDKLSSRNDVMSIKVNCKPRLDKSFYWKKLGHQ